MLPLSSILTAAATGEVDLQQLLPTILIVVCGIVLLIAFFVGFAKGWRRVSWAGCVWLVACLAFFLLHGGIGEAFAQTLAPILAGLSLDGSVAAFAAAFVLAAALVLFAITTERRAECKCSVKPLFLLYLISGGVLFLIGTALLILSFIIL